MKFNIAKEYTEIPGGRYIKDGDYSGEHFRETVLYSKLKDCIDNKEKLTIILDGGYGYSTSFLEEAFGGLIRKYKLDVEKVLDTLVIISEDEPELSQKIKKYIQDESK